MATTNYSRYSKDIEDIEILKPNVERFIAEEMIEFREKFCYGALRNPDIALSVAQQINSTRYK